MASGWGGRVAGAVAAVVVGAAAAAAFELQAQGFAGAEDAHGGVAAGDAFGSGKVFDGDALDLDRLQGGRVFGLEALRQALHALADGCFELRLRRLG